MEERRDVMTTHSHVESRSALTNGSPDRVSDSHSPSSQLGLTGVTGPEPEVRARRPFRAPLFESFTAG